MDLLLVEKIVLGVWYMHVKVSIGIISSHCTYWGLEIVYVQHKGLLFTAIVCLLENRISERVAAINTNRNDSHHKEDTC